MERVIRIKVNKYSILLGGRICSLKKEEKGVITTRVTQTSESARLEEMVAQKAKEQNKKCPECGHVNKHEDIPCIGLRREDGRRVEYGKCEKCKAKWETIY